MRNLLTFILLLTVSFANAAYGVDKDTLKIRKSPKKIEKVKASDYRVSQADTLTNEFLDTLTIKKKLVVNDYSLIGVQYGAGLSQVMWNPRQEQAMLFVPVNFGVTYTKYGKMFDMPLFAFKAGLFYAQEGYQFEYNEEYDWTYKIEGAEKAVFDVVEVPLLFQFHYDTWNFKIIAEIGCYGGYRMAIHRFPGKTGSVKPELEHSFTDTDIRLRNQRWRRYRSCIRSYRNTFDGLVQAFILIALHA